MTKRKQTAQERVHLLATDLGVTLKPGGGLTTPRDVDLPELGLTVEITMRVRPLVTREQRVNFEEEAIARISDHQRGAWTDTCACRVRDRGYNGYARSNSTNACKKPVIGVVVNKVDRWDTTKRCTYTEYSYSFRCHVHLSKREDEPSTVFRGTLGPHALKEARAKRTKDLGEFNRLSKLTPEERIIEDAKAYGREAEVKEAIERQDAHLAREVFGKTQTATLVEKHEPRCNVLRSPLGKLRGENGAGDLNYECTCGARVPAFYFAGWFARNLKALRSMGVEQRIAALEDATAGCDECKALQGDTCSKCYHRHQVLRGLVSPWMVCPDGVGGGTCSDPCCDRCGHTNPQPSAPQEVESP